MTAAGNEKDRPNRRPLNLRKYIKWWTFSVLHSRPKRQ